MSRDFWRWLRPGLLLALAAMLVFGGCSTMKKWVGMESEDDKELAEEVTAPEAQQETVMIDGKPYVRSKNPYWLVYPNQPEYLYVEKGREMVGLQQHLINSLAKAVGKEQAKSAGKTVPPDKLQELVRQEVERILQEQGLGGFVSRGKAEKAPVAGRAVAIIPDLDTPKNYDGLNRTMAAALSEVLGRQKDLKVSGQDQVQEALRKAGVAGKLTLPQNVRALGDSLGVQGLILTGVVPPEKGAPGVMMLEVYDTFLGTKAQSMAEPVEGAGLKPETVTRFARQNAMRAAAEVMNIEWFGRVEFVKEGKVYLSLGQNAGLKVGDRLKVVSPGKEVVNPHTKAVLGYTADVPQGELKVTELLGSSGAVALAVSGGPFKSNEKVKAR